jgi:acetyltransferase
MQQVKTRAPGAGVDGILVQSMAGTGVEMILGIKRDPMFGPVVLCGLGGLFVEILKDVVIGIPPLSKAQAREMLARLRGARVLEGARGNPPADREALADAIVNLSHLALDLSDRLESLDINPVIVQSNGVAAVDALIQIRDLQNV